MQTQSRRCLMVAVFPAFAVALTLVLPSLAFCGSFSSPVAQEAPDTSGSTGGKPSQRTEKQLIAALEVMQDAPGAEYTLADLHGKGIDHKKKIVETVDELLRLYPKTSWRDEALILQMRMLAHLTQAKPEYLSRFHSVTTSVAQSKPTGALAVEGAYYSIQVFVLAARAQKMPQEKQWLGAMERYQAFVNDFPDSERTPIMWASLIRNAVKLGRSDEARKQLEKMQQKYPKHEATARAYGEVGRVNAVGQPFVINMSTQEGEPAGTADYYGKVLIVHSWATWSRQSIDELPGLVALYEKHKDDGLALMGINADRTPHAFLGVVKDLDLEWQQYYDGKGFRNVVLVMLGISKLPDYRIVDRQGYLRAINPKEGVAKFVEKLLKEPVKPIKITPPSQEEPTPDTANPKTPKPEATKPKKSP